MLIYHDDKLKMGWIFILLFQLNLILKVKDNSPIKQQDLTNVFYTFEPNLVVLAWTCDELLCSQTHGWTHRQMAGNDNTQRSKLASKLASGKNHRLSGNLYGKPCSLGNRDYCSPFDYDGLTLTPARISNYIHCKMWDEIIYPFLNFNNCTVEVWEWISNFNLHFTIDVITYLCWDYPC